MSKTIVTVVGSRPQFVKAAALSRGLNELKGIDEIILHTGQHYDRQMSEAFFDQLDIAQPYCNLDVGSGTHAEQTAKMLLGIEQQLLSRTVDLVLVYGDTNSTISAALVAAKLNIPLAHVEAGLRSYNREMPEEVNRVVCDHLSDLLFAPTEVAKKNLAKEGIEESKVHLVGDVMYDALRYYEKKSAGSIDVCKRFGLSKSNYILGTIHRAENTDSSDRLNAIFSGLETVAKQIPVILPLHPRTRKALNTEQITISNENLKLVEPLGYLEMIELQKHASLIVTDSGGVQKEAFFQKVPCVTLREETEWTELVDCGVNILVPPENSDRVSTGILSYLAKEINFGSVEELYGRSAVEKTSNVIASFFQ